MAQLLRPPPKRRPSQIASQASAGSQSIPSQPASAANASAVDLVALGELKTALSPRGHAPPRPPLNSPTKSIDAQPKDSVPVAGSQCDEGSSAKVVQAATSAEPAAAAEASTTDAASDTKTAASGEFASPFEQVQEPAAVVAAAKSLPKTASPFADAV